MNKYNYKRSNFKKLPLDIKEHKQLAEDLLKAQKLLEPWMDRFYKAYSVNGREVRELRKVLNLLSSKICCSQDNHWYALKESQEEGHNCPYYGKGKIVW